MEFYSQIAAVTAVLALMAACLWLLRKKGLAQFAVGRRPLPAARHVEVIDRVFLTPQHSVHLVRVGGRALLIGVSPSQCAAIERFDSTEFEAGPR